MHACQALTGAAGGPPPSSSRPRRARSDPGLEPFWAGTISPEPRHGLPSFQQVLAGIANA